MPALLIDLIAAVFSLLSGGLLASSQAQKLFKILFSRASGFLHEEDELPYTAKIENLTNSMLKASQEMDQLLAEFAQTTIKRKKTMEKVEAELLALQQRHTELEMRIDQLKDVPIPVAQEFAKLTQSGETRSARRDYFLFGLGVVVSTLIAIGLKLIGLG